MDSPLVSVIIPTLGRAKSLEKTLQSLNAQRYTRWELVLVTDPGPLARLRNEGANRAKGEILSFTEDDVVLSPGWLSGVVEGFRYGSVGGVSGPCTIPHAYRHNRDLFRFHFIKRLYDWIFLDGRAHLPGKITEAGAWTTGANDEGCDYEGEVDYLEACNMSWRKEAFQAVGGFDEAYGGVGDWSEPDLAFRVRNCGWRLLFTQGATLRHCPSVGGAYSRRKGDRARLDNYLLFSRRHIKPHWRHSLYKSFLRSYYAYKGVMG